VRRISAVGAVAGGACTGIGALRLASALGVAVSPQGLAAAAAATAGLALLVAGRTASWAWRGPVLVSFPRDGSAVCDPAEAEVVRSAAQLRGTMGGAGYVHRARLAFPSLAWASAAAVSVLAGPLPAAGLAWALLLAVSGGAVLLFPAKPFHYREATGGRVVVYPAAARADLLKHARAGAPEDRQARSSPGGGS